MEGATTMSQQLRSGIQKLRKYYIERLLKSGIYQESDQELYDLTLSELKAMTIKTLPQPKK
jgi:hypothetical protein